MKLQFTKMHGLGNDFMVFDAINQSVQLSPAQLQQLGDRHRGIGFDQLLLVEKGAEGFDFRYRIFNADGSEVENCGNGARCFARFVNEQGLSNKTELRVITAGGPILLQQQGDLISVNMGQPNFAPASLPFITEQQMPRYSVADDHGNIEFGAVSMGNPHIVLPTDDIRSAPVERLGPLLESHPIFPNRVNVGFAQVIDNHTAKLRVYERGAAETLACGTGACAAMAVNHIWGNLADEAQIQLPGGNLEIRWRKGEDLWMTGPAETVYHGEIELD